MRPVNLLPEQQRRRASGAGRGGWTVIGVLAALLAAVGAYVFTANQATSRENEAVRLESEAKRMSTEADNLAGYTAFQQLRKVRAQSVRDRAESRFDWERLVREMAHVLPDQVWLSEVDASTDGRSAGDEGGSSSSASSSSASASTGGSGSVASGQPQLPKMKLKGCARKQDPVADTLVRLRLMAGVREVVLRKSMRPSIDEGETGAQAAATGGDGGQDCGKTGHKPNFEWEIDVIFERPQASGTGRSEGEVPVSLGGGQ